jgi:putative glycosyl hydrolase
MRIGKGEVQGGRVTRLVVVLAALALPLCAASTAEAARTEFFGIAQGALDAPDAQQMADIGVRTERFQLKWREVESTKGSYDWTARDWLVGALASRGIRPVPFVWGSPQWVGTGAAARPPIDSAADVQAWQTFLKAAVARYGPGGSYWANGYRQRFGADATPLPVQSWQVWNEPNLKKYFSPGATVEQSAQKYARLLGISHDAIKSRDPNARIVLAGMPGYGDVTAWKFLNNLYQISGFKSDFDAAALHPFAPNLDELRREIVQFRGAMTSHADGPTPLWITELAWGSGEPDQFGLNKTPTGQRDLLISAYKLILQNRSAWNVQRLFWFLWHDPPPGSYYATLCSICGTAGLVDHTRSPKLAYYAFRDFTAETTPPVARIISGPSEGGLTKNSTPSFYFDSNEPGSTFVCRVDAGANKTCDSPYTLPQLSDGPHTFYVKAMDAPGNESAFVSRSFTVDTHAPAMPQITDTDPNSPANENQPEVKGSAEAGSTVKLDNPVGGTGAPVASGSAAQFASPGLSVSVADNTTTSFRARATDAAGNVSPCSAARAYVEDSSAPAPPNINDTDPNSPANNNAPKVKGFSPAGSTVALYKTVGCTGAPVASGSAAQFASPGFSTSVADNTTTSFRATARDAAGNVSPCSAARLYVEDSTAPAPPQITDTDPNSPANDNAPKVKGLAEAGSTVSLYKAFACTGTRLALGSAAQFASPGFSTSVADNTTTAFRARATDAAGNVSPCSTTFTYVEDSTAPQTTITAGPSGTTTDDTPTFSFASSESGSTFQCRFDSQAFAACSGPGASHTPSTPLSVGAHNFAVRATDRAKNVDATPATRTFTVVP